MTNETKLKQLREKIIEAVPEIMELKFGCEVECYSIGMWGHKASHYFFRVIEEQFLSGNKLIEAQKHCDFKPYSKLKLSCIGFQNKYENWVNYNIYPKSVEIYIPLLSKHNEYKAVPLSDIYNGEIKILGRNITIGDILETLHYHSIFYMVDTAGQLLKSVSSEREYEETDVWWNLNKPLQDQDQKTIDLLWNLICKE